MEPEPEAEKSSSGVARVLDLLGIYFGVPSREGFSAYRTGWLVHFVFSALLAAGITAAAVAMGLTLVAGLVAAVLGVVLLWGVGAFVGIVSHYSPLILLGALAVGGGSLFFPAAAAYVVLGVPVAVAVHLVIVPVLALGLRLLRKLFR